jgi:hypothetical protein
VRPIHCANCRHCLVFGSPADPKAYCEMGHGPPQRQLWSLIREKQPMCFRRADECPDFDSMSGDTFSPATVTHPARSGAL